MGAQCSCIPPRHLQLLLSIAIAWPMAHSALRASSIIGIHAAYPLLHASKHLGLYKVTTLDNLVTSVGVGGLAVHLEQLGRVKFGGTQNLGLADVDVVEGVDALACVSTQSHTSGVGSSRCPLDPPCRPFRSLVQCSPGQTS